MKGEFFNKVALVTGATMGVGKAIAIELFNRGATVVITGRKLSIASIVAKQIDSSGERVVPMQLEVKDHLSVKSVMEKIAQEVGQLNFLVNNAGITGPHGVAIGDYTVEDWHNIIGTDLTGAFYCMKYALPNLVKSRGAIVNLSAVNGVVGIAGIAPYTVAKHGIIGLTQAAALEYASQGVRINAVCPGYVDTEKQQMLSHDVRAKMAASHPMNRMATGQEVAKTVAFLLSDDSSFTTGAYYAIDGGYTAQ